MKRKSTSRTRITPHIFDGVKKMYGAGMRTSEIAKILGIGKSTTRFIGNAESFEEYKKNQNPNNRGQKQEELPLIPNAKIFQPFCITFITDIEEAKAIQQSISDRTGGIATLFKEWSE